MNNFERIRIPENTFLTLDILKSKSIFGKILNYMLQSSLLLSTINQNDYCRVSDIHSILINMQIPPNFQFVDEVIKSTSVLKLLDENNYHILICNMIKHGYEFIISILFKADTNLNCELVKNCNLFITYVLKLQMFELFSSLNIYKEIAKAFIEKLLEMLGNPFVEDFEQAVDHFNMIVMIMNKFSFDEEYATYIVNTIMQILQISDQNIGNLARGKLSHIELEIITYYISIIKNVYRNKIIKLAPPLKTCLENILAHPSVGEFGAVIQYLIFEILNKGTTIP